GTPRRPWRARNPALAMATATKRSTKASMSAKAQTFPSVLQESAPIVAPGHTYESISRAVSDVVLEKPMPRPWYACLGLGLFLLSILGASTAYLFWEGVGIWGINIPVGWGFAIINLVWWI